MTMLTDLVENYITLPEVPLAPTHNNTTTQHSTPNPLYPSPPIQQSLKTQTAPRERESSIPAVQRAKVFSSPSYQSIFSRDSLDSPEGNRKESLLSPRKRSKERQEGKDEPAAPMGVGGVGSGVNRKRERTDSNSKKKEKKEEERKEKEERRERKEREKEEREQKKKEEREKEKEKEKEKGKKGKDKKQVDFMSNSHRLELADMYKDEVLRMEIADLQKQLQMKQLELSSMSPSSSRPSLAASLIGSQAEPDPTNPPNSQGLGTNNSNDKVT